MSANANWVRWIVSSIQQYFETNKQGIELFFEGTPRETKDEKDFAEVRIDGPHITEISKNYFLLKVDVNILVQSTMDEEDFHRIHTNVGKLVSVMTNIPIYKYGDGVDDDDSLLGCLRLVQDAQGREPILVARLGQIEPTTPIEQVDIEGHYKMHLEV